MISTLEHDLRPEPQPAATIGSVATAAFLMAVAALLGHAGDYRVSLDRFLFLALLLFGFAALLKRVWRVLPALERCLLLAGTILLLPLPMHSEFGGLLYMAFLLYLLSQAVLRNEAALADELVSLVVATGAIAVILVLVRSVPLAWMAVDVCFREVSLAVNRFGFGVPYSIGPTFFACEWLLFYWLFVLVRRVRSPSGRWFTGRLLVAFLLPLIAVPVLHLLGGMWRAADVTSPMVYERLFDTGGQRRLFTSLADYISPRNLRPFLVLLVVAVDLAWVGRPSRGPVQGRQAGPSVRLCGAALLALIVCSAILLPVLRRENTLPRSETPGVVRIFDPTGLLTLPPNDEQHGFVFSGMFAKLPVYLSLLGYEVDGWTPEQDRLDPRDVLVLINLPEPFETIRQTEILEFVRAGGSLLCLGDHVAGEQIAGPFNQLLAPTGIRFNRDTACSPGGWTPDLLQLHQHIRVDEFPQGDRVDGAAIGTGASLHLDGDAAPIFVGRNGFADDPNPQNEIGGELGDLTYRYGEDIGDLVLAAEDRLGDGRVVVFGDTSSFQNSSILFSHNLVARVFRYLAVDGPRPTRWSLFLLPLFAAALMMLCRNDLALGGVVVLLLLFGHDWIERDLRGRCRPGIEFRGDVANRVAFVDNVHHSSYLPWAGSLEGIGGIDNGLLRRGIVTLSLSTGFDDLDRGRYLFILAPCAAISESEANRLVAFMERGGNVIVTADPEHAAAMKELLLFRKISVRDEPLGEFQAPSSLGDDLLVEFTSGWPVDTVVREQSLVRAWGRDLAMQFTFGRGTLIVFGDGRFLREDNLESRDQHHPLNVKFFRVLIERMCEGEEEER